MEAEAVATLRESLRLNDELKQRFDRLGEFADRVEHLRTAKLVNEGQIIALKEQIQHLEALGKQPPSKTTRSPRKAKAAPKNEWHHLAQILHDADQSKKVTVVGRSRLQVLAQLESHVGKEKAEKLSKKMRVYKKLSKGPHSKVVVFTKGAQTPTSVKRLLEERQVTQPAFVLHQGRLSKV